MKRMHTRSSFLFTEGEVACIVTDASSCVCLCAYGCVVWGIRIHAISTLPGHKEIVEGTMSQRNKEIKSF